MNQQRKKIFFSVTNCICHDQRVLKIAETADRLYGDVTIIGRRSGECCDSTFVPFMTRRFKMLFRKGFLFYSFFNLRLFLYLLFHKADILVSNDLDTLLPNWLVSKIRKSVLVFDSHEYFTGVPELQNRTFVRWVWKTIERSILPGLQNVMTVSESIALKYKVEYGIESAIVRNCSRSSNLISPYTRKELELNDEHLLLILQGTGINTDRGGIELIDALRNTENVALFVIGSGNVIQLMKERVIDLNLAERIRFLPKMSWNEMMRYTKSVDAGLSLDKNSSINHSFSLPNKVFDYISAGIPVISGSLPEVNKITGAFNCGIIISEVNPTEISRAIIKLRDNKAFLAELKMNAVAASEVLNWENENHVVEEFYKKVSG